jgi:hypothetical protein
MFYEVGGERDGATPTPSSAVRCVLKEIEFVCGSMVWCRGGRVCVCVCSCRNR